jgi:RimJ/RimL family protein N-acetyltransferase
LIFTAFVTAWRDCDIGRTFDFISSILVFLCWDNWAGISIMQTAAAFSTTEILPSGQRVEIRALRSTDREGMLTAVARSSTQSLYRRFFTVRRHFSEAETTFFLNLDFVNHVALVAVAEEGAKPFIAGGARYIIIKPGRAEVAFAVVDQFQGRGIGSALLRHLSSLARQAGLQVFEAEVLPENAAMLKVFEKSGLEVTTKRDSHTIHIILGLT